ncbi:MAG: hypothetical protein A2X54_04305 [Nitrospirae bacterium GWF2_44_13]|nr:MAG: hypothetical protein A2X54_04305 [Nitrospirae bacterium GWF2_44_13]OGW33984.1 MAG: hypothetical protein A2088_00890 [Nitrospirae bacterium GWD2_44_7]OGW64349.1 MAG: hypothetical protein A2222_03005 [Nitrospirae bacterium RIFOXYA2_FULL_44_9]OGW74526.1 MAG: hypothetical protein A2484_07545 [Nitrospirae bacterium RIFOXYC2_FULL_44_7]HBG93300.1 hypothetical protein [Nitrospiraceae bacterium]
MKGKGMMILHILNDGPTALSDRIIAAQSEDNVVKVIDLTKKSVSYENIIDRIFSSEKVISW